MDLWKYQEDVRAFRSRQKRVHRRYSVFANWLREHPNVKLPPSMPEIAKVTGIKYNTIKCYLWRKKQQAKKEFAIWAKQHKDLLKSATLYVSYFLPYKQAFIELKNGEKHEVRYKKIKDLEEVFQWLTKKS